MSRAQRQRVTIKEIEELRAVTGAPPSATALLREALLASEGNLSAAVGVFFALQQQKGANTAAAAVVEPAHEVLLDAEVEVPRRQPAAVISVSSSIDTAPAAAAPTECLSSQEDCILVDEEDSDSSTEPAASPAPPAAASSSATAPAPRPQGPLQVPGWPKLLKSITAESSSTYRGAIPDFSKARLLVWAEAGVAGKGEAASSRGEASSGALTGTGASRSAAGSASSGAAASSIWAGFKSKSSSSISGGGSSSSLGSAPALPSAAFPGLNLAAEPAATAPHAIVRWGLVLDGSGKALPVDPLAWVRQGPSGGSYRRSDILYSSSGSMEEDVGVGTEPTIRLANPTAMGRLSPEVCRVLGPLLRAGLVRCSASALQAPDTLQHGCAVFIAVHTQLQPAALLLLRGGRRLLRVAASLAGGGSVEALLDATAATAGPGLLALLRGCLFDLMTASKTGRVVVALPPVAPAPAPAKAAAASAAEAEGEEGEAVTDNAEEKVDAAVSAALLGEKEDGDGGSGATATSASDAGTRVVLARAPGLPLAPQPPGIKRPLLRPYQRQGLAWMLSRETGKPPVGYDPYALPTSERRLPPGSACPVCSSTVTQGGGCGCTPLPAGGAGGMITLPASMSLGGLTSAMSLTALMTAASDAVSSTGGDGGAGGDAETEAEATEMQLAPVSLHASWAAARSASEQARAPSPAVASSSSSDSEGEAVVVVDATPPEATGSSAALPKSSPWTPIPLAAGGGRLYVDPLSRTASVAPFAPALDCRGGILADLMGLGKTLQVAALIVAQRGADAAARRRARGEGGGGAAADGGGAAPDGGGAAPDGEQEPPNGDEEEEEEDEEAGNAFTPPEGAFHTSRSPSTTTLVVVPTSMLSQWAAELSRYTGGGLRVLQHSGTQRPKSAAALAAADVVVTSYHTLATEFVSARAHRAAGSSACPPLLAVSWARVVLDEAHVIRNPSTLMSQACCALTARARWALTGSPIINSLQDVFALFKFLRYTPCGLRDWWRTHISAPFEAGDPGALLRLRQSLHIMLRRNKAMMDVDGRLIGDLPPLTVRTVPITLAPQEAALYGSLYAAFQERLSGLVASKAAIMRQFAAVLSLLLRLRQVCVHPALVLGKGTSGEAAEGGAGGAATDDDTAAASTSSSSKSSNNSSSIESLSSPSFLRRAYASAFPGPLPDPFTLASSGLTSSKLSLLVQELEAIRAHNERVLAAEATAASSGGGGKSRSGAALPPNAASFFAGASRKHQAQRPSRATSAVSSAAATKSATPTAALTLDDSASSSDTAAHATADDDEDGDIVLAPPRSDKGRLAGSKRPRPASLSGSDGEGDGRAVTVHSSPIALELSGSSAAGSGSKAGSGQGPPRRRRIALTLADTSSSSSSSDDGEEEEEKEGRRQGSGSAAAGLLLRAPRGAVVMDVEEDDDGSGGTAGGALQPLAALPAPPPAIETVLPDGTVLSGFTRVIVFSFFTQFLDIVGGALTSRAGWGPTSLSRLDGTMSVAAREAALASFKGTASDGGLARPSSSSSSSSSSPPLPCWVLLLSASSGSQGLNITEANVAYLCDPFWSPSIEAQAVARMWRLGQTKHVWVRRLVVTSSIEEKILLLQRKKAVLSDALVEGGETQEGSGGKDGGGSKSGGLTAEDLQLLFSGGGGLGLRPPAAQAAAAASAGDAGPAAAAAVSDDDDDDDVCVIDDE